MKSSSITIAFLATLLLVTNAWWAYRLVDLGITSDYRDQQARLAREALAQAIAVVPAAMSPDARREDVIAAAQRGADTPGEPFEKDGFVWVGSLGLRFTPDGRLAEIAPAWR